MCKIIHIFNNGNKLIRFKDNKFHSLGKIFKYLGDYYIVCESEIELKNNVYFCTVSCSKLNDFKVKKVKNEHIVGSSLKGKVIKTLEIDGKAYMNVDFSEFLVQKYGKIQSFGKNYKDIPYKTFYSQSNTGLFPSPEINDIVDVVFVDNDESNMKVSWSLENENSSRFNDGEKRNYLNQVLDFKFNKDIFYLNFKNKIEVLSDNLTLNSNNMLFSSKEKIGLASELDVYIEANDDLEIFGKIIDVKSKGGDINVLSSNNIHLKGKQIHND